MSGIELRCIDCRGLPGAPGTPAAPAGLAWYDRPGSCRRSPAGRGSRSGHPHHAAWGTC